MLNKNRFHNLTGYPQKKSFQEFDYQTNTEDTISEFTEMLGDEFISELVSDTTIDKKESKLVSQ